MKLELLAPAKNLEQGMLAINCGADAVYIGASKFGARTAVGNSLSDIEALAKYAHRYWSKVFVAFNTILYDHELEEAEKMIHQLHATGIDALIIQDMGILEMDLPKIPLHASTQTFIANPQKAFFLEKQGFERLILARELSADEIKAIRDVTSIELEAFVHGALCVSYSGQCYLSHALCQRSGNRGECCQACRNEYNLEDATGKTLIRNAHLLSLRDFNLSAQLSKLIDAGITSFKIEGRLKDSDYIKNVVTHYRKALDQVLKQYGSKHKKASSGHINTHFETHVEETFNRGYIDYYIDGKRRSFANFASSGYVGTAIGTVRNITPKFIEIAFQADGANPIRLANGDGIAFFDKQGKLRGSNINKIEENKIYLQNSDGLFSGAKIFRNFNRLYIKELEQAKIERKIEVTFAINQESESLVLHACDEDNIHAQVPIDGSIEPAENAGKALENINKLLSRTGDSIFENAHTTVSCDTAYFIPASALNQARRQILQILEENRLKHFPGPEFHNKNVGLSNYPFGETVTYLGNISNRLAKQFYEKRGVTQLEDAFELQNTANYEGKVVMTTRHCIKYEMGLCHKNKNPDPQIKQFVSVNQLFDTREPFYLINSGRRFRLRFDCARCVMEVIHC